MFIDWCIFWFCWKFFEFFLFDEFLSCKVVVGVFERLFELIICRWFFLGWEFWMLMKEEYVFFLSINNFLWELVLMIWLVCMIVIRLVLWMVDKWWVIMMVVCFIVVWFKVVWMICFDLEFKVLVVLFRSSIGGFLSKVCVIVIFCFWFLDICMFFLFIMVL